MKKLWLWEVQWESQSHQPKWWGWNLYPELIPNPVFPPTEPMRVFSLCISDETAICLNWTYKTQNKFHISTSGHGVGVASVQWAAVSDEVERSRVRAVWNLSAWEPGFISAPASVQLWLCRHSTQCGLRLLVRSYVTESKRQWWQT